jgi:hypothetical protein
VEVLGSAPARAVALPRQRRRDDGSARARHSASRTRPGRFLLALVLTLLLSVVSGQVVARGTARFWGPVRPGLAADVGTAPLGLPQAAPSGAGGYRFLNQQDDGSGRPVRWDPCRPIHYVLRPDQAPPGGAEAIAAAVARIQQITGLRFVFDGYTTEMPRPSRPTMDPARYGQRWSPVLVAWTDPAEYPPMSGYAGLGGADPVPGERAGTSRYVTGVVLLNRRHLGTVAGWPNGAARIRAVALHEFGHLAGLDHVDDPRQLMYDRPTTLAFDFAEGDLRGLAALSDGPCFRDF